ncbi:MAG: hypothetical protein E6I81_02760 [Chloroflexi bacterium]|nr:MAG: hypothetical protein E6I81_02760 [Chloroflexota bacterium]
MRKLIRTPLAWMVAAEIAVVGALVVVGWHVVVSASHPVAAAPVVTSPDAAGDAPTPLPDLPLLSPQRQLGPLPGLNIDAGFWRERLAQLNRDQVDLEQVQWRIVHSAEDAVKHYIETVVLPAIQRAEEAGGEGPGLTLLG